MTQSVEKRCLARPAWTHNCDHLCWLNKAGLIKKYFLVTLSIVFYYLWVRNSTKTRVLALTPLSLVKRHDVRDASPFKQHLVMLLNWSAGGNSGIPLVLKISMIYLIWFRNSF